MGADVDSETLDSMFDVLASPCRRRVIYLLREQGPVVVDELADVLGTWSAVVEHGGAAGPDDSESARVLLHHVHLPKLREAGLVEYTPGDPIALTVLADEVEELLDVVGDLERGAASPEAVDELLSDWE